MPSKLRIGIVALAISIVAASVPPAAALQLNTWNDTVGGQWKVQCKKEGGSLRACCLRKEEECLDDGDTKSNCTIRVNACLKKTVRPWNVNKHMLFQSDRFNQRVLGQ